MVLAATLAMLSTPPLAPALRDGTGWTTSGAANFAWVQREGREAGEIRAETPDYSSLSFVLRSVRAGESFRGRVDVRTDSPQGVAYAVLEFQRAGGERVSIEHSPIAAGAGSREWQTLGVAGVVPDGADQVRLGLIFNAKGTGWFSRPNLARVASPIAVPPASDRVRRLTIGKPVERQPAFIGIGFHCFEHAFDWSAADMAVFVRRWREANPSFARINHQMGWTSADLAKVAVHLRRIRSTGARILANTWDPPAVRDAASAEAFARRIADDLIAFRDRHGVPIDWYCMSNELSQDGWGALRGDLDRFRNAHRALRAEFRRRGLRTHLLATDESPFFGGSVEWAAATMADVTHAYGGHYYINSFAPKDPNFHGFFRAMLRDATEVSRAQAKPYILGEFGSKQDGSTKDGVFQDRCVYYDTPEEPYAALQTAEAAIAAIDAGVSAAAYWTFVDLPDSLKASGYVNKWGAVRATGEDRSPRAVFYAFGLISRAFRPGRLLAVRGDDPLLRTAAVRRDDGTTAVAVLSRHAVPVRLAMPGRWRMSVWRASEPEPRAGALAARTPAQPILTLPPNSLVVLESVRG